MYISSIPAQRLSDYKVEAESKNTEHKKSNLKATWRHARVYNKPTILKSGALECSQDKKIIWLNDLDDGPFTNEGDVRKILGGRNYGAWYTDNFQDGTVTGAVVSVRHAHKLDEEGAHRVYMPACYHSDWDSTRVYREFYDSKEEAARAADHYAERDAEECREDDAQNQAEQEIIRLREELHGLNKSTLQLIKDVKTGAALPESICSLIESTIYNAVERRTRAFKRIKALKDNYWEAVY